MPREYSAPTFPLVASFLTSLRLKVANESGEESASAAGKEAKFDVDEPNFAIHGASSQSTAVMHTIPVSSKSALL